MPVSIALEGWGGFFYLCNKLFMSVAERIENASLRRKWKILAWMVYIIGFPAWMVILVSQRNWIAAAVEAGCVPSMFFGLITALKGHGQAPKWLNSFAKIGVFLGLGFSWYDFGSIISLSQFLEIGVASGFLVGAYLLARERLHGYSWLMLGNLSCASLMAIQGCLLLMVQQLTAFVFVVDAFFSRWKRSRIM